MILVPVFTGIAVKVGRVHQNDRGSAIGLVPLFEKLNPRNMAQRRTIVVTAKSKYQKVEMTVKIEQYGTREEMSKLTERVKNLLHTNLSFSPFGFNASEITIKK